MWCCRGRDASLQKRGKGLARLSGRNFPRTHSDLATSPILNVPQKREDDIKINPSPNSAFDSQWYINSKFRVHLANPGLTDVRMGDAEITASQWRLVEVGRVVLFSSGEFKGRLAAIVEIVDHKRVRYYEADPAECCGNLPVVVKYFIIRLTYANRCSLKGLRHQKIRPCLDIPPGSRTSRWLLLSSRNYRAVLGLGRSNLAGIVMRSRRSGNPAHGLRAGPSLTREDNWTISSDSRSWSWGNRFVTIFMFIWKHSFAPRSLVLFINRTICYARQTP